MSIENKEINIPLLFAISENGCHSLSLSYKFPIYFCKQGCPVMQCGNFIEPWECHYDDRSSKNYAIRIIKKYKLEETKKYKTISWNKIKEIN